MPKVNYIEQKFHKTSITMVLVCSMFTLDQWLKHIFLYVQRNTFKVGIGCMNYNFSMLKALHIIAQIIKLPKPNTIIEWYPFKFWVLMIIDISFKLSVPEPLFWR